jgi:hypothetical protein
MVEDGETGRLRMKERLGDWPLYGGRRLDEQGNLRVRDGS